MKKFNELNIQEAILSALKDLEYKEATAVQEQVIPKLKEGNDIIILSQTGSGKTFAFGIPVIEHIDTELKKQQALIICPTRELATQVSSELKNLTKYMQGIKIFAVFGGQPIYKQIDGLKKKPQIIVGTPGRIIDHIERRTLKLESVDMLVLDEADEMLKMGFREDIENICGKLAGHRQSILASATMSKEIKILTEKFLNNPITIDAGGSNSPAKTISQEYITVSPRHKKETLLSMLQTLDGTALVFCNTKKMTTDLYEYLNEQGITASEIHGDMRQNERTRAMNAFKKGIAKILVATDVAARGIDVNNITYVINYDYPEMEDYYIHRIGRTGRAGSLGKAFTFITTNNQMSNLLALSKQLNFNITKSELSTTDFNRNKSTSVQNRFNKKNTNNSSKKYFSKDNYRKDKKNNYKKDNKDNYRKDDKDSYKKDNKDNYRKDDKDSYKKDGKKDYKSNKSNSQKKFSNKNYSSQNKKIR